jgi:hypothetical protein
MSIESMTWSSVTALAHNLIHRRCAEAALDFTLLSKQAGSSVKNADFAAIGPPASFLRNRKIARRINALWRSQSACTQSYPQKMCRTSHSGSLHGTIFEEAGFVPRLSPISPFAFFSRSRNFPIRIKLLSDSHRSCAQSYPQNLCRTFGAVPASAPFPPVLDIFPNCRTSDIGITVEPVIRWPAGQFRHELHGCLKFTH